MVHDFYVLPGQDARESKGQWDYYKLLATVPGDDAFRPLRRVPPPEEVGAARWGPTAAANPIDGFQVDRARSLERCGCNGRYASLAETTDRLGSDAVSGPLDPSGSHGSSCACGSSFRRRASDIERFTRERFERACPSRAWFICHRQFRHQSAGVMTRDGRGCVATRIDGTRSGKSTSSCATAKTAYGSPSPRDDELDGGDPPGRSRRLHRLFDP
jgi:hypothetical protein